MAKKGKQYKNYSPGFKIGVIMDLLCSYTVAGKNKHDDVPDGMAMLSEFAQSFNRNKVEVFTRYF